MSHIFLTGGTGVIGSALIPQLLVEPDVRLTVLLRANSPAELDRRAQLLIDFCGIRDAAAIGRVCFVTGDVCRERLAIAANDYRELADTVTGIIHSAGSVKLNQSLDEARRTAVAPIQHLLNLARRAKQLRKIDVVSTIGVAGRLPGLIPERQLIEPRDFHNTYECAKSHAEDILWGALADGLPITIHRPSMVVGDSRNGAIPHYQVFYYLCDFLTGHQTFGYLPDFGDASLDLVPVNYVAQAISFSAVHESDAAQVLHLCAGDRPELKLNALSARIWLIYKSVGRDLRNHRRLPLQTFALLTKIASWIGTRRMRTSARRLQYFLPYLNQWQQFSVQATTELLASRNIASAPPVAYLPRILAPYLLDIRPSIPRRTCMPTAAQ